MLGSDPERKKKRPYMDTANMSRNSDDDNSPDDLIAELARLMADDARGEPEPEKKSEDQGDQAQAGQEVTASQAASDAVQSADEHSRAPQAASTSSPSDRLDPERGDAMYDYDDDFGDRPVPRFAPTFRNPDSRVSALQEEEDQKYSMPSDWRTEQPEAPESEPTLSDWRSAERPEPAPQEPAPHAPEGDTGAQEPAMPEAADEAETSPYGNGDDDPLGELIASQLESSRPAEAPEPQPSRYEPRTEPETREPEAESDDNSDNFDVPPVFGMTGANAEPAQETGKSDPLDDIESLIGEAVTLGVAPETDPPAQSADRQQSGPRQQAEERQEPVFAKDRGNDDEVSGAASAAEAAIMAATSSVHGERPTRSDVPQRAEPAFEETARQGGSEPAVAPAAGAGAASAAAVSEPNFDAPQHGGDEPPYESDDELRADPAERPRRSLWQRLVGPGIAAALLIAVGTGLYWMFGMQPGPESEAPVLSAEAEPARTPPPEDSSTAEAEAGSSSVVFDDLEGNAEVGNTEQLVSRDQTAGASAGEVTSGSDVSRVISAENPAANASNGLVNRTVRTVTVRPDGTIVRGDESTVAGSEELPVDRPNVPDLPEDSQTAATELADQPIETTTTGTMEVASADAGAAADAGSAAQTGDAAGATETASDAAVPPMPRPRIGDRPTAATQTTNAGTAATTNTGNDQAVDLIASLAADATGDTATSNQSSGAETANAGATAPASSTSAPATTNAAAYVQLSSQRSEEAAQDTVTTLRSQYADLLGESQLEIQRVDLDDRGVFFRVRMPANSLESANSTCNSIKQAGGDCFVRTN